MSNVDKYRLAWQIARIEAKGVCCEKKVLLIKEFYKKNFSQQNKERILNWIHGLLISLKKDGDKCVITELCFFIEDSVPGVAVELEETVDCFFQQDSVILSKLWDDLMLRNKKWLKDLSFFS